MRGLFKNLRAFSNRGLYILLATILGAMQLSFFGVHKVSAAIEQPLLMTKDASGNPANGPSSLPQTTSDGHDIFYKSDAQNIVQGVDQMTSYYVYRYDTQTQVSTVVDSGVPNETNLILQEFRVSPDGRYIAFAFDVTYPGGNGASRSKAYIKDMESNATVQLVPGPGQEIKSIANDGTVLLDYGPPNQSAHSFRVIPKTGWSSNLTPFSIDNAISAIISPDGQRVSYVTTQKILENSFSYYTFNLVTKDVGSQQTLSNKFIRGLRDVSNHNLQPRGNLFGASTDGRYLGITLLSNYVHNKDYPSGCEYYMYGNDPVCVRVYRYDTVNDTFELADILSNGSDPMMPAWNDIGYSSEGVRMSEDGNKIVYYRGNGTLVNLQVHDFITGATEVLGDIKHDGAYPYPGVSVALSGSSVVSGELGTESPNGQLYIYDLANAFTDNRDHTKPVINSFDWNGNNPKHQTTIENGGIPVYVHASDNASQLLQTEFIIDNDETSRAKYFANTVQQVVPTDYSDQYVWAAWISDEWSVGDHVLKVRVQDGSGNWSDWAESQFTVIPDSMPDTTSPMLGGFSWSLNPKPSSQSSGLTVPATDDESGISGGEYFIGDNDPGQGNGATMNWDGANLTTTFGTDFPTGVYKISVRAQDNAGNWSEPVSDYLVVYDPSGPRMTGKRTITPSLSNGDILPGLINGGQTDTAIFALSVKYDASGQIAGNSDFQLSYQTGTKCKNASQAQNCHSFNLDANSIAWLTTQGTNNSTGVFQGTATLVVDGATRQVMFRVTGVDGSRISSTSPDSFEVRVFAQGDDPNTSSPIYVINPTSITQGDIKIV